MTESQRSAFLKSEAFRVIKAGQARA